MVVLARRAPPEERAELVRPALSLCRGRAPADLVSEEFVQGEIRRLEETRRQLTDDEPARYLPELLGRASLRGVEQLLRPAAGDQRIRVVVDALARDQPVLRLEEDDGLHGARAPVGV